MSICFPLLSAEVSESSYTVVLRKITLFAQRSGIPIMFLFRHPSGNHSSVWATVYTTQLVMHWPVNMERDCPWALSQYISTHTVNDELLYKDHRGKKREKNLRINVVMQTQTLGIPRGWDKCCFLYDKPTIHGPVAPLTVTYAVVCITAVLDWTEPPWKLFSKQVTLASLACCGWNAEMLSS